MGALGCKYCNCDREKMEDETEEMKVQNNTPILLTKEKKNNENHINKNDDLNLNIDINNIIEHNENQTPLKSSKIESNNKKNDIYSSNKDIIDNTNPPKESNNIIQISSLNNQNKNNDKNINNDNKNDNNDNNIKMKNSNNEVFIIEENISNNNINTNKKGELKQNKTNQFSISNTKDAKKKIKKFEINKIQFGFGEEDKENLNKEQMKLYNEAQNNLKQFNAPQGNEISQVQNIMTNILYKLKNIFINIDLNSNRDDANYILLNDNLKKMINYEINAHNTTMYSERFCILYPKILKYYKSKVQFLKNLQPACVLPINQISAVNIAKPKKSNKKLYHLIICNKLGIRKNINNSVFLNLFDSCEINDYLASPDLNESLLIFTSDDEKDIYKWYIVIQYLIDFSKQEQNF